MAWKSEEAALMQQNKLDYDTWGLNNTPVGKFHSSMKDVRQLPARAADWVMSQWDGDG